MNSQTVETKPIGQQTMYTYTTTPQSYQTSQLLVNNINNMINTTYTQPSMQAQIPPQIPQTQTSIPLQPRNQNCWNVIDHINDFGNISLNNNILYCSISTFNNKQNKI